MRRPAWPLLRAAPLLPALPTLPWLDGANANSPRRSEDQLGAPPVIPLLPALPTLPTLPLPEGADANSPRLDAKTPRRGVSNTSTEVPQSEPDYSFRSPSKALGEADSSEAESEQESETISPCCSPRPGDMVELKGSSVPAEFRGKAAVVTKVSDGSCTVVALNTPRQGIGECWPNKHDVLRQADSFRLGTRVKIQGLAAKSRASLNGAFGEVVQHPRETAGVGFVSKPSLAHPQMTVCVKLDTPWQGKRNVLLEPRYLTTSL